MNFFFKVNWLFVPLGFRDIENKKRMIIMHYNLLIYSYYPVKFLPCP